MAVSEDRYEYAVRATFTLSGAIYDTMGEYDSLAHAQRIAERNNLNEGDDIMRGEITPDAKCDWTVVRRIKPVEPGEWEEF